MIRQIEERIKDLLEDCQEFPEEGRKVPYIWLSSLWANANILKKLSPNNPLTVKAKAFYYKHKNPGDPDPIGPF